MVGSSCALFLVGIASFVFRIAVFIRPMLFQPMFFVSFLSYASSFVVRSDLGMHRDNRDVVFRSFQVVLSSWLFRCYIFSFVRRLSLRFVRRGSRAYVS